MRRDNQTLEVLLLLSLRDLQFIAAYYRQKEGDEAKEALEHIHGGLEKAIALLQTH